ncbi:hypothetical protein GCM10023258_02080 [Terrabacter aeriphilus]|uniref:Uncharacterized protein n=1 Tax=Terrabacter aeriphilus TaxID=515662 RepID=A0ABP9J0A8_9MICO
MDRLVVRVVDDDAADLALALGVPRDQLEERVPQVLEHPPEAGTRTLAHRPRIGLADALDGESTSSVPDGPQSAIHSEDVVTASSTSGIGLTPRPGPSGTSM